MGDPSDPPLQHLAVSGLTVRLPVPVADNWIDEDALAVASNNLLNEIVQVISIIMTKVYLIFYNVLLYINSLQT